MVICHSTAKFFLRLVLIAAALRSPAQAETFRCQGPDGHVAYQENPCKKGDIPHKIDLEPRPITGIGSGELIAGIAAFEKKEFESAASIILPLAEKNIPEAQYYAAQLYLNGAGVKQESVKALQLMQASADGGYEKAQLAMPGFLWLLFGYNIGDIRLKISDATIRPEIWKRSKKAFLIKPCENELRNLIQQFVDANKEYAQEWVKLLQENVSCLKCRFPCVK